MHSTPSMQPLYARIETKTKTGIFLTIPGYAIMAMTSSKSKLTFQQIEKIISGIKEVVYTK